MKFGKLIKRVMHAPWADKYVDYKSLKQSIKRVSAALEAFLIDHSSDCANNDQSKGRHSIDTTRLNIGRLNFFRSISNEVQKINRFYFEKLDEWEAAFQSIADQSIQQSTSQLTNESRLSEFRSLCDQLDKLRSFVLLNHLAFIKILKKYDKHAHVQMIKQSMQHPNNHSNDQSVLQVYQHLFIDNESASFTVMQSIIQSNNQSNFYASPRLGLLIASVQVQMTQLQQSLNQSKNRSSDQSIHQTIDQQQSNEDTMLIDMNDQVISSTDQSVTQSTKQSIDQSINQMIDPHINQTINQTVNQTVDLIEWTCPICLDVLNMPVILSCSHKFCFGCLVNWSFRSINQSNNQTSSSLIKQSSNPKCPVCRLEMPISPENFSVCSMLDEFLKRFYPNNQPSSESNNQSSSQTEETVAQTATGEFDDDLMGVSKYNNHSHSHSISQSIDQSASQAIEPSSGPSVAHSVNLSVSARQSANLTNQSVNQILHLSDILSVCRPGSYVAFDIDDTLHTNLYAPCLLTTARGVEAYQAILARNPLYKSLTVRQRNSVTRVLQTALDAKRLVESDTAIIVKQLQNSGCRVFGLTKRFANSAAETRRELLTMGIDFVQSNSHSNNQSVTQSNNQSNNQRSNPFPAGRKYFDELTESLLIDGVIYTNGHEKGPVLDRFMSQVLFQRHIDMSSADGSFNQSIKEWSLQCSDQSIDQSTQRSDVHPCASYAPLPINLVFVDDLVENAHSVFGDMTLCQRFGIPIYSCSYHAIKHQTDQLEIEYERQVQSTFNQSNSQHSVHTEMELLQYQVYHLIHQNQVINDHDAKLMVTKLKQKAADDSANQSNHQSISQPPIHTSHSIKQARGYSNGSHTHQFNGSADYSIDSSNKHQTFTDRVEYMEVES